MKKDNQWNRPGMHSSDYGRSIRNDHDQRNYSTSENFYGKGPKGYQKRDSLIQEEVCEKLFWSPEVDASDIDVQVQEGIVNLKGFVDSRHAKKEAERILDTITGIKDIQNHLIIRKQLDFEEDKIIARGDHGLYSQEIIQK